MGSAVGPSSRAIAVTMPSPRSALPMPLRSPSSSARRWLCRNSSSARSTSLPPPRGRHSTAAGRRGCRAPRSRLVDRRPSGPEAGPLRHTVASQLRRRPTRQVRSPRLGPLPEWPMRMQAASAGGRAPVYLPTSVPAAARTARGRRRSGARCRVVRPRRTSRAPAEGWRSRARNRPARSPAPPSSDVALPPQRMPGRTRPCAGGWHLRRNRFRVGRRRIRGWSRAC